jgi:hypothetical protein
MNRKILCGLVVASAVLVGACSSAQTRDIKETYCACMADARSHPYACMKFTEMAHRFAWKWEWERLGDVAIAGCKK